MEENIATTHVVPLNDETAGSIDMDSNISHSCVYATFVRNVSIKPFNTVNLT